MRRLAAILLLAPVLAGCTQTGGSSSAADFKGDERDVADAISDFSSSAGRKEASKACAESLSVALNKRIADGGASCASELKKAFDDADGQSIDIDDVTITGTTATARVTTTDGDNDIEATFKLVDQDGDWHIDSFGEPRPKG